MNKKIIELLKNTHHVYTRVYNAFMPDEWGSWINSIPGGSSISNGLIRSVCSGYTNSANLPRPNSSRTIDGLKYAKSINFVFSCYQKTTKGWYVREQPDGYMQLLNGYIMVRYGGYACHVMVNGNRFVTTVNNVSYSLSFYQDYLICNGTRYDYPSGIKLSNALGNNIYAYSFGGFITSNDYFECSCDLKVSNITVEYLT